MKVLKKGRKQKGWASEMKCTGRGNGGGGCGALLLVEEEDVFLTHNSCMGESDYFFTFKCPECWVKTDIPDGTIPAHLSTKLHGKRIDDERKHA